MKKLSWQIMLGLALILISAVLYSLHYAIFRDSHHLFIYLMGDIAFVPVEVLLATLIIHRILNAREKQAMIKKLNMVIGTFYSEAGTDLLGMLSRFHKEREKLSSVLNVNGTWSEKQFSNVRSHAAFNQCIIDTGNNGLEDVKRFLSGHKMFLLGLMENPNLLEHEAFTDMLWAVFHLMHELEHRADVTMLGDRDREHLNGDIRRVYTTLIGQWLSYMEHLKKDYPYLFSLAVRTNPFDPEARVEIA